MQKRRSKQKKQTRLQKLKEAYHKHFILANDEHFDVVYGVVFSNHLDSDAVWLYLTGPAGSGKTETLDPLEISDETFFLDQWTNQTLISGFKSQDDKSLAPLLNDKTLIIVDFSPWLSRSRNEVAEMLGQLRRLYDGKMVARFGTGKEVRCRSKFGLIIGVTGAIDKHTRQVAELGERFLFYRLPPLNYTKRVQVGNKAMNDLQQKARQEELRSLAQQVLDYRAEKTPELPDTLKREITEIAELVSRARTPVERDHYTKEILYPPCIEEPGRLAKQLANLARGIAMAREKKTVTESEIQLIRKVGLDTMPANRLEQLKVSYTALPGEVKTADFENKLHVTAKTARIVLQDLILLKILNGKKETVTSGSFNTKRWIGKLKERYARILKKLWAFTS